MFFLICLFIFTIGQCMPMPLDPSIDNPSSSSNSTVKLPCLPPIDGSTKINPSPINEQEFEDCMQKEIDKFSRIDNKTRAILERVEKLKKESKQFGNQKPPPNSPLFEEAKELTTLLFDAKDTDKDGFLTADEISQFEVHFMFPYFIETTIKDSHHTQLERAFVFAYLAGDLERTKAQLDKDAAKKVERLDTNGDGKLSREEIKKFI